MTAQWTTWVDLYPNNPPCQFSSEKTRENYSFLKDYLGETWINRSLTLAGTENHPLLHAWSSPGPDAFFELNCLAEDLRVLANVTGLDKVLVDLKDAKRYLPTKHTIHTAALFARESTQHVTHFFEAGGSTKPDFAILIDSKELVVEAKLFQDSDIEVSFEEYAKPVCELLIKEVLKGHCVYPTIIVVLKDSQARPSIDTLIEVSSRTLDMFMSQGVSLGRSADFNVIVQYQDPPPRGLAVYRSCCILCPRSEKENLRVQGRSNDASGQIRPFSDLGIPGMLCLGFHRSQQPKEIATILIKRFTIGHYTSISAALLIKPEVFLGLPQSMSYDLIGTLRNPNAKTPMAIKPVLSSIGEQIFLNRLEFDEIPAYRVSLVVGLPIDIDNAYMPWSSPTLRLNYLH